VFLRTQGKLFSTVRDRKGLLEIFQGFPHPEDLVCQSSLDRDDDNIKSVLSPRE
jgi:hypothetical protein